VDTPPADALFVDALCSGGEFEQIEILKDQEIGFMGFIAIHSTRLGPAFGGIRRWSYGSPGEALRDALRLSSHMTLKCAIHGIPGGGGKAVLDWRPGTDRKAAYRRLGEHVDAMGGRFFTGPDVGTEPEDLRVVAEATSFVTIPGEVGGPGPGDLGAATALGVFAGIGAAARRIGRDDLRGAHVVLSGLGDVGGRLGPLLADAGARLSVADILEDRVEEAVRRWGATAVDPRRAHAIECDVFAPCALGGVVSEATLPELGARAIAGSANNVLATGACGADLHRRGIVYAPDFVINSGGLVQGALFLLEGAPPPPERIAKIGGLLDGIFADSERDDLPPEVIAERTARARVDSAPNRIYVPNRP
jgi:leucine dehydrogenase